MINLSEDKKTGIYTVILNASEARYVRELNAALIKELDAHQREYNKTKTSNTRRFIDERIVETEKELQSAEEVLKNFMDRNRRIENSPALQLEQQRLSREVTVLTGVFTTLKQQLETSKIEEVRDLDYVIVLDPPEVPIYPIETQKIMIVFISGLFGIGLGIFFGFTMDYMENRNKKEREKMSMLKSLIKKNITGFIPNFLNKR